MTLRLASKVVAVTDPFGVVAQEMIEPDDRGLWSDVEVFANLQRKTSGKPSFIAFLRAFSPSGSSLETLSPVAAIQLRSRAVPPLFLRLRSIELALRAGLARNANRTPRAHARG